MAKEKLTDKQMELIFDTMEEIYSEEISWQEGIEEIKSKIGQKRYENASYIILFNILKCMKNGKTFKRGFSHEITEFFINKIKDKYDKEALEKALEATKGYIKYLYIGNKYKSKGLVKICKQITKDNNIDISFEDKDLFPQSNIYTKEKFLQEVFISEKEYNKLVDLIKDKQNIILQGSAGAGKTYAAKRLAYSIIGEENKKQVKMIQFHQSYSYEDFIMGFRPSENEGFELKEGVFYRFCKEAEDDEDNEYFLIIDEINRGNISKIFGELFMLIENDKRGEELELLYKDELFSVPKNLYIIGLMNTADRSLAMLDYALRRRFAFYEMKPAFDSEQFKNYKNKLNNNKFNNLIETVKELNKGISEELGEGFCIGHSYFCNLQTVTDDKLSQIIEYELIPLLKEYWFDDKDKVNDWDKKLRDSIK